MELSFSAVEANCSHLHHSMQRRQRRIWLPIRVDRYEIAERHRAAADEQCKMQQTHEEGPAVLNVNEMLTSVPRWRRGINGAWIWLEVGQLHQKNGPHSMISKRSYSSEGSVRDIHELQLRIACISESRTDEDLSPYGGPMRTTVSGKSSKA
jgi:hypothetical protein